MGLDDSQIFHFKRQDGKPSQLKVKKDLKNEKSIISTATEHQNGPRIGVKERTHTSLLTQIKEFSGYALRKAQKREILSIHQAYLFVSFL